MLSIQSPLISFKSNDYREDMNISTSYLLRQQEKARKKRDEEHAKQKRLEEEQRKKREEEEERARQEELQRTRVRILGEMTKEFSRYPDIDNKLSTDMARFLSQFTCAIQNDTQHDIREFFADEETAKGIREKLSPECQHNSIELRDKIQKFDETNDPVMMLIAANRMWKFVPIAGILTEEQQTNLVKGLKDTVLMAIKNTDLTRFDNDEQRSILEMVRMIEASDTVDFGISVKLKALVDKLNRKNLNLGFIPPVEVKQLETTMKQAVKNMQ